MNPGRWAILAALISPPILAHAVSMSTGELRIEGSRATYELRLPLYEAAHIRDPARQLFESISFSAGDRDARILERSCREESSDSSYRCRALYEFDRNPAALKVRSKLTAILVPNHIHVLKATKDGVSDQAVLDLAFPNADLTFQPASARTGAIGEAVAGAAHALSGVSQVLFLMALVMAGRTRRELLVLTICFLAAQVAVALILPHTAWYPAPRFVEAASALTIAYLALEMLMFPKAGQRWAVVTLLGAIHGLYLSLLLSGTTYHAAYILSGATFAQLTAVAFFAGAWMFLLHAAPGMKPVTWASSMLLAVGLGWFFVRLRS